MIATKHRNLPLPRFVRVIFAMIMREMSTSYGKSSFGYLWAVLEPVGGIAVLSIAFSLALRAPSLGESFPLFYASAYVPFVAFNIMQRSINGCIRENRQLLFYPRVTYMDALIGRFILTFLTQFLVGVIIFGGIILIFNVRLNVDPIQIANALLAANILGLGLGAINSVIVYLFPGWRQVWMIITRPLFFISCIFYLFESLPVWAQNILWYNPLVHVTGTMRSGFYATYRAEYVSLIYVYGIGFVALFIGLLLMRRYASDMIN